MTAAPKTRSRKAAAKEAEPSALEAIAEMASHASSEATEPAPLVDLDEGASERPTARFGGERYDIRILDDFGIRQQQKLTRDGREFFRLWSSDEELSEEDGTRLERLLHEMFEAVFDAPEDIKAKLSDGKRAQVVLGFTLAPLAQRMAQTQEQDPETSEQ